MTGCSINVSFMQNMQISSRGLLCVLCFRESGSPDPSSVPPLDGDSGCLCVLCVH